jgi:hypothetical protein
MSLPPVSVQPPQIPLAEPSAPITPVAGKDAGPVPLDMVIITCETDFRLETDRLRKEAATASINAEFISIFKLPGYFMEAKLASLNKAILAMRASGKINEATIFWISLHGAAGTDSANTASQGVYGLSAGGGLMEFSGEQLVSALRHGSLPGDVPQADFHGLIVWSSCEVRKMEATLKAGGGENITLAGNKAILSADGNACMFEVFDLIAARKREGLPPLAGRDYWMHLRNVSGEHIAYVQDDFTEIHKVLASGSGEPVLTSREGRSGEQPRRILEAKVSHGSAKAIQAVFDKFGKDAFPGVTRTDIYGLIGLDSYHDAEGIQAKTNVLEKYGYGFPGNTDELINYLSNCTQSRNARMAAVLLQSQTKDLARMLCEAVERIAAGPKNLRQDLEQLFAQRKDIMQQWFSVYREGLPPEIGRALDRYLKDTVRDSERAELTARVCLADRDTCLMNLLRNAFELSTDFVEAESLMPFLGQMYGASKALCYAYEISHRYSDSRYDKARVLINRHVIYNPPSETFLFYKELFRSTENWISEPRKKPIRF